MINNKTIYLLLFIFSTFIYSINNWFSVSGFYILIATIFIYFLAKSSNKKISLIQVEFDSLLKLTLVFFILIYFTVDVVDINGQLSASMFINRFAIFLSILLVSSYLINSKIILFRNLISSRYALLISLVLVIQLTLLRVNLEPDIDVYRVLRFGPLQILELNNPYNTLKVNPVTGNQTPYEYFAYGPAAILFFMPIDIFFHDPRYLLVIANFVTAFCILKIARLSGYNEQSAQIISLLYLFTPKQLSFLTFSISDILIVSFIAIAILLYRLKNTGWFLFSLALAVGIKFFYLIPFLYFFKIPKLRQIKIIAIFLLALSSIYVPFAIMDFNVFYKSLISANIDSSYVQRASLTLFNVIDRQFHIYPPSQMFYILLVIVFVLFWFVSKAVKRFSDVLALVGIAFIAIIFIGPIGNANYYFTASLSFLFAIAYSDKA